MGVEIKERRPGEFWLYIDHHGKRKAKKNGRNQEKAQAIAKQVKAKLVLKNWPFLSSLGSREIIDAETIESEMRPLREQRESMLSELGKSRMAKSGLDLTDDDLKKGIEHLSKILENADPRIKKRAFHALLGEVRI
jgi:hypothetical protein